MSKGRESSRKGGGEGGGGGRGKRQERKGKGGGKDWGTNINTIGSTQERVEGVTY